MEVKQNKGRPRPRRLISNSSRNTWASCRYRWWLSTVAGIQPIGTPRGLSYGTLAHKGLEGYWRTLMEAQRASGVTQPDLDRVKLAMERGIHEEVREREAVLARAAGSAGFVAMEAEAELEAQRATRAAVLDLCSRYADRYWTHDCSEYIVLDVEWEFRFPVPGPRGGRMGVDYAGRLDVVVEARSIPGAVLAMEHKTADIRRAQDYIGRLVFDGQPVGYAWALQQRFPGRRVHVIYDVMRNKVPAEPEILKSGRVSSRANTDTTLEAFRAALARTNSPEEDYPDIMARLHQERRDGTWMHRDMHPVTQEDIAAFLEDIRGMAREYGRSPYYRNVSMCNIPSRPCPYRTWCSARGTPERLVPGYIKLEADGLPVELSRPNPEDASFRPEMDNDMDMGF